MAIAKNGPNGSLSGKFGSVIAYTLNGQDIIKGLPKKRTKKPSAKEQANRDKFAQMQAWLAPILAFLQIGFKGYAPTFQGFVAAKSYNSKQAFVQKEDGTWFIDPVLALVSFGTLPLPKTISMEHKDDEISFTWSTEGSHELSHAMLLAHMPDTRKMECNLAAAKRSEGKASLSISELEKGYEAHLYIAFVNYNHSAQSNSYYLGTIIT